MIKRLFIALFFLAYITTVYSSDKADQLHNLIEEIERDLKSNKLSDVILKIDKIKVLKEDFYEEIIDSILQGLPEDMISIEEISGLNFHQKIAPIFESVTEKYNYYLEIKETIVSKDSTEDKVKCIDQLSQYYYDIKTKINQIYKIKEDYDIFDNLLSDLLVQVNADGNDKDSLSLPEILIKIYAYKMDGYNNEKVEELAEIILNYFETNKFEFICVVPNEVGYLSTGINQPASLQIKNVSTKSTIKGFPVVIEGEFEQYGYLTIASDYYSQPNSFYSIDSMMETESFYIKSFATLSRDNMFTVTVGDKLLEAINFFIDENYGTYSNVNSNIPAASTFYVRKPSPFSSYEYAENFTLFNVPKVDDLTNDYISVSISGNGQFTIGAEKKSLLSSRFTEMDMIYGHPNMSGADGIWSSYTSFKVDGNVYKFHQMEMTSDIVKTSDCLITTKILGDLVIKQILQIDENPETGVNNRIKIQYRIINNSNTLKKIDTRIMLDTWAGLNDGVPFRIPLYDEKRSIIGKKIITQETKLYIDEINYWETYEPDLGKGSLVSFGKLIPKEGPLPDSVQLLAWGHAFSYPFDIEPEFYPLTGDSSIAIFWLNHELAPGEEKVFETYYGMRSYENALTHTKIIDINSNPFSITMTKLNTLADDINGIIEIVNMPDHVEYLSKNEDELSYSVISGTEKNIILTFSAIPVLDETFDIDLKITENGIIEFVKCTFINHIKDNPIIVKSVIMPNTPIFATYYDLDNLVKKDHYVIAELLDRNGKVVEKIILYDDGKHEDEKEGDGKYSNSFNIKADEGDYRIQIKIVK